MVCDISKIYQYHDHFSISLSFISNFDTALVDFDVYQKHDNKILKNISINIQVLVWLHSHARNEGWFCTI